jgi:hypothetical protein
MRQKDIRESLNLSKNFAQIPSSILKPDRHPDDFITLSYSRDLKTGQLRCALTDGKEKEAAGGPGGSDRLRDSLRRLSANNLFPCSAKYNKNLRRICRGKGFGAPMDIFIL